jgi:hypothetical protein
MRNPQNLRALLRSVTIGTLAVGIFVAGRSGPFAQAATQAPMTFARDVAPILQDKCQSCHRPGEIAPMSLLTYADVRPWARSVKAKVVAREMPPWFVDTKVGIQQFKNDASLSDQQIDTIVRWVDAGAPLGDPKDLPALKQWPNPNTWRLAALMGRPPDLVVTAPAYTMPAVANDQYPTLGPVDVGLGEDRYIKAIEIKPNLEGRRVLHHSEMSVIQAESLPLPRDVAQAIVVNHRQGPAHLPLVGGNADAVNLDESPARPQSVNSDEAEAGAGSVHLLDWEIGKTGDIYPDNTGKLLKAGAKLTWGQHYHAAGKEITNTTETAFWFYPKGTEPKYHTFYVPIGSRYRDKLEIPPGVVNEHYAYWAAPTPVLITNFQPHMHIRGKAMLMEAIYPDGRSEVLSYSPNWNFNWHISAIYADNVAPLLPKGTIVKITAWHDNTVANKTNPDPAQWVTYGQRSVDEMAHANTEVVFLTEEDYQRMLQERQKDQSRRTN